MSRTNELVETWINGNRTDAAEACKDDAVLATDVALGIALHCSLAEMRAFRQRLEEVSALT